MRPLDRLSKPDKTLACKAAEFHATAEHARARQAGEMQVSRDIYSDAVELISDKLVNDPANYAAFRKTLLSFSKVICPDLPTLAKDMELATWMQKNATLVQQLDGILQQCRNMQQSGGKQPGRWNIGDAEPRAVRERFWSDGHGNSGRTK